MYVVCSMHYRTATSSVPFDRLSTEFHPRCDKDTRSTNKIKMKVSNVITVHVFLINEYEICACREFAIFYSHNSKLDLAGIYFAKHAHFLKMANYLATKIRFHLFDLVSCSFNNTHLNI